MTGLQRQTRILTAVTVVTILMLSKLFLPLALWVPLMKTTAFFTGWGPITWQCQRPLENVSNLAI